MHTPINDQAHIVMISDASRASLEVSLEFLGVASHAAASAHLGRSALDAVEIMIVGLQFLRDQLPRSSKIQHAITDTGGIAANVVQARARLQVAITSNEAHETQLCLQRVIDVGRGAALMTETTLEFEIQA